MSRTTVEEREAKNNHWKNLFKSAKKAGFTDMDSAFCLKLLLDYNDLEREKNRMVKALETFASPDMWRFHTEAYQSMGQEFLTEWRGIDCPLDIANQALPAPPKAEKEEGI